MIALFQAFFFIVSHHSTRCADGRAHTKNPDVHTPLFEMTINNNIDYPKPVPKYICPTVEAQRNATDRCKEPRSVLSLSSHRFSTSSGIKAQSLLFWTTNSVALSRHGFLATRLSEQKHVVSYSARLNTDAYITRKEQLAGTFMYTRSLGIFNSLLTLVLC